MRKINCLFFAFACVCTTLMAQTPAHIDLNVQLKDANGPKRDARLEVEITIEQNGAKVYKETRSPVWTNYDGFLSIQVGKVNPAQWTQIDWNAATKRVIIKGRPNGQSGAQYEVLYDDFLPVAAYAQFVKPYERPGVGSVKLFSNTAHPNIELKGNHPVDNFPFIDFETNVSSEDSNFVARIHTWSDRRLYFNTRGGVSVFRKWPVSSLVEVWTGGNAGINLKGGSPRIDFYHPTDATSPRNGRIILDNDRLLLQSSQTNLELDAGSNSITYTAGQHNFDGGPIIVSGSRNFGIGSYTYLAYGDSNQAVIDYGNVCDCATDGNGVPFNTRKRLGTTRRQDTETNYGIKVTEGIAAERFHAYSDNRIKILQGYTKTKDGLEIMEKLNVANFFYKDFIHKGAVLKTGFLAQEVEKIFPQAVSQTTDVIPDIFQIGKDVIFDTATNTLTVTVDSLSDLKVGEKVRLIGEQQHLVEVMEVNGTTFNVKDWPEENTKEVFVYGREVDDFRTLDYDQIFTLNVSATQALIKEVEELKTQLAAQKQVSESLQNENQNLKAELRRINSRIDALGSAQK